MEICGGHLACCIGFSSCLGAKVSLNGGSRGVTEKRKRLVDKIVKMFFKCLSQLQGLIIGNLWESVSCLSFLFFSIQRTVHNVFNGKSPDFTGWQILFIQLSPRSHHPVHPLVVTVLYSQPTGSGFEPQYPQAGLQASSSKRPSPPSCCLNGKKCSRSLWMKLSAE